MRTETVNCDECGEPIDGESARAIRIIGKFKLFQGSEQRIDFSENILHQSIDFCGNWCLTRFLKGE